MHSWKTLSPINWKNISYCGLFAKDSNSHEQAPLSSFENPHELCCHSPIRFRMKRKPGSCWETRGLPALPNLSVGLSRALPAPQKADDVTLGLILSIPHVVEAEAGISLLLFASFHNMKGIGRKLGVCIHICKQAQAQGRSPVPTCQLSMLWALKHTAHLGGLVMWWVRSICRSLCLFLTVSSFWQKLDLVTYYRRTWVMSLDEVKAFPRSSRHNQSCESHACCSAELAFVLITRIGSCLCPAMCLTRVIQNMLWVLHVFHFAWVSAPTAILICTRSLGSLLWCEPLCMDNRCYQPYVHVALHGGRRVRVLTQVN